MSGIIVAGEGNCSGVYLPTFETFTEGANDFGLTGLGRGGQQVQRYFITLVLLT